MTLNQLGDGPIEDAYREKMTAIAGALDRLFNGDAKKLDRTTGFVLLVFPFGREGRCNYISNAERADVVNLLKEQLSYFAGQPEEMRDSA